MTKFIAYVNETDLGCDYTIACGKILWILDATTYDEAMAELKHKVISPDDGHYELKSVTFYQVCNETEVQIRQWWEEYAEQEEVRQNELKDSEELAEYNRLRSKFNTDVR